jgi:hypothetical protein
MRQTTTQLVASYAPIRAGEVSPLRVATDGDASLTLGSPSPSLTRPPESTARSAQRHAKIHRLRTIKPV